MLLETQSAQELLGKLKEAAEGAGGGAIVVVSVSPQSRAALAGGRVCEWVWLPR